MKITVGKDPLFEGLQKVFTVVPQKPTLPVLTNFLLQIRPDECIISGTDMDISITTSVPCSADGEGSVMVNAKRFLSVVRELPPGEIAIHIEDSKVTIEFAQGQSSILGQVSEDYPEIRAVTDGMSIALSGGELVEMIDKTAFAVATDRTRVALTGVFWRVTGNEMVMVATDGHRLSLFGRREEIPAEKNAEAIVPQKALNQASRVLAGGESLESVSFGDKAIMFDFGATKIFSKLIEGPYPNFRQVIPADNSKKVYIQAADLEAAVRRVSVLSDTITHQIRFSVEVGKMVISTENSDIGGEARETVPVRYDGEAISIGFNANFMLEILKKVDSDEVLLELETPTSAGIMKPQGRQSGEELLYLIMPLRLSEQK